MTTAAELVALIQPSELPKMAAADVPAIPNVEVALRKAAHGNHRNLYRGWLDKPGTVRVRVYIGGVADEHAGEILAGTTKDITFGELQKDDTLAYFEYRDTLADNTLVMVWLPAEATHKGIKVTM